MKTYKQLVNTLANDDMLRGLSDEEVHQLRNTLIKAYTDLDECCRKHGLTLMLIGGSVLGAVRHQGFIPWDDDLDAAMTRRDFETLKEVFEMELGEEYILSSPNYGNAIGRFPAVLVRDTLLVEAGRKEDDLSKAKIDIFIIDNIPETKALRAIKGVYCSMMMFITSCVELYEHNDENLRRYLCKTSEGKKAYRRRHSIGKLFAWKKFIKWVDATDKSFQYDKETAYMGIPSGRKHYFGEIRKRETFLPTTKGMFEGIEVNLPGNPHDYLTNLYGSNYMTLPPEEDRERHLIIDLKIREGK